MKRKLSVALFIVALALMIGGGLGAPAHSAPAAINLRCGLPTPPGSPHHKFLIAMNDYLAQNGLVTIEIFTDSLLGSERELPEYVSMGTVAMALIAVPQLANFVPSFYILDFPYFFADRAKAIEVLNGEVGRKLLDKLHAANIHALGIAQQGFRQFQNNVRPVVSVEDARGIKIRTIENELYQRMFESIGVFPTLMSTSEVVTALEQGTVEGVDYALTAIYTSGAYVGIRYVTITEHILGFLVPMINLELWNSFPPEIREELNNATAYALGRNAMELLEDEAAVIRRLEEDFVLSYADKEEWRAATAGVADVYLNRIDMDLYNELLEALN